MKQVAFIIVLIVVSELSMGSSDSKTEAVSAALSLPDVPNDHQDEWAIRYPDLEKKSLFQQIEGISEFIEEFAGDDPEGQIAYAAFTFDFLQNGFISRPGYGRSHYPIGWEFEAQNCGRKWLHKLVDYLIKDRIEREPSVSNSIRTILLIAVCLDAWTKGRSWTLYMPEKLKAVDAALRPMCAKLMFTEEAEITPGWMSPELDFANESLKNIWGLVVEEYESAKRSR